MPYYRASSSRTPTSRPRASPRSRAPPLAKPRCSELAEETSAVPFVVDVTGREAAEFQYFLLDECPIRGRAAKGGSVDLVVACGALHLRLDQPHVLWVEAEAQEDDAARNAHGIPNLAD